MNGNYTYQAFKREWIKNKEMTINSKYLISKTYHMGHLGVDKGKKILFKWHILPYCICWVFKVQFLCSYNKRLLVFYTVLGAVSKWKACHKYQLWEANGAQFGLDWVRLQLNAGISFSSHHVPVSYTSC